MTIELPGEIENQLREAAQVARFRSAVSQRRTMLEAGDSVDGKEAMARLIFPIGERVRFQPLCRWRDE